MLFYEVVRNTRLTEYYLRISKSITALRCPCLDLAAERGGTVGSRKAGLLTKGRVACDKPQSRQNG